MEYRDKSYTEIKRRSNQTIKFKVGKHGFVPFPPFYNYLSYEIIGNKENKNFVIHFVFYYQLKQTVMNEV